MPETPRDRWERFLIGFFGAGNKVDWPSSHADVVAFVEANERGLERKPIGPFVLPRVDPDGRTTYFAIAPDSDQAHELQTLLGAVVGPTYTTFDGRPVHPTGDYDQVIEAAIQLAGGRERVFTFVVADSSPDAKRYVRQQVHLMLALSHARPTRKVDPVRPIGRLLRDFDRALEERDLARAEHLLFGPIAETGRLSGLNRLFLQVRLLAAAQEWEQLDHLPSLNDLLRAPRPALVSDALAQLAMRRFDQSEPIGGEGELDRFYRTAGGRFGALITGVDRIRSRASARYYVRWQLAGGEPVADVRQRLDGLAWAEDADLARLLADVSTPAPPITALGVEAVTDCIVAGRFDAALDLLGDAPASVDLLPALLQLIATTFSADGMRTLERYREELGADVVEEAVGRLRAEARPVDVESLEPALDATATWAQRLRDVAAGTVSSDELVAMAQEGSLIDVVRDPEQLDQVADAVHSAAGGARASAVVDAALGILRRLDELVPEASRRRLQPLRAAVIDLWCLGDDSGDLTRAGDILDVLDDVLAGGCSAAEYEEYVELLSARWSSLLTDVAFGLGVRAVEVLIAGQPSEVHALNAFALQLFGRVTGSNADRLDLADLVVADSLCDELHLGLIPSALRTEGGSSEGPGVEWLGRIGLYGLDENATRRATEVLATLLPGAEILSSHDKVSSSPLRNLSSSSAVMVVAAGVAKHAATDAIRAARGDRPLDYAAGKGSSSLIRAALVGVWREASMLVAT